MPSRPSECTVRLTSAAGASKLCARKNAVENIVRIADSCAKVNEQRATLNLICRFSRNLALNHDELIPNVLPKCHARACRGTLPGHTKSENLTRTRRVGNDEPPNRSRMPCCRRRLCRERFVF